MEHSEIAFTEAQAHFCAAPLFDQPKEESFITLADGVDEQPV
jgi:hypothetical protein